MFNRQHRILFFDNEAGMSAGTTAAHISVKEKITC